MKVLVAYATRMGSTAEIAERIGRQLRAAGHDVDVSSCEDAGPVGSYQAVILGSALYMGRWDRRASRFLRRAAAQLAGRPTWLFQSGPCGAGFDLAAVAVPRSVRKVVARFDLGPVTTFGGRLDRLRAVSVLQRWMATGTYAGDFRDWEQIAAWTDTVSAKLAEGNRLPTSVF